MKKAIVVFLMLVVSLLGGCFKLTPLQGNRLELENKLQNLMWVVYEPASSTPTNEEITEELEKIRNVGIEGIVIKEDLLSEFDIQKEISKFGGIILEVSPDTAASAASEDVDGYLFDNLNSEVEEQMEILRKETSKPVSYRGNLEGYNFGKVDFVYAVETGSLSQNPYESAVNTISKYNELAERTFKPVVLEVKMPSEPLGFSEKNQSRYYDLLYQSGINFVWGVAFDKDDETSEGLWKGGLPKMIVRPKVFIQDVFNGTAEDAYDGKIKGYVMNVSDDDLDKFAVSCYIHRESALILQAKDEISTYPIQYNRIWMIPVEKGEEFVVLLVNSGCEELPVWPPQIPEALSFDCRHILPAPSSGSFAEADIVPGYGIAGIKLAEYGDKARFQFHHLGGDAPCKILYTDGVISLENNVVTIAALDANGNEELDYPDVVLQVFVKYPYSGKTKGGNGIGSSEESIEDEFGEPDGVWCDANINYLFYYRKGIVFAISNSSNKCSLAGVYFPKVSEESAVSESGKLINILRKNSKE